MARELIQPSSDGPSRYLTVSEWVATRGDGVLSASPYPQTGSFANATGQGSWLWRDSQFTFTYQATIISAGTGTGAVKFDLPYSGFGSTPWILEGWEFSTGFGLRPVLSGGTVEVLTALNASPIANGRILVVSGSYRTA